MESCEHLSEINPYLSLMYWEERTSNMECSNRVTAFYESIITVDALHGINAENKFRT